MLWCDLRHRVYQNIERIEIFLQVLFPGDIVHVFQGNLYLFANGEQIAFLVIGVKIHRTGQVIELQSEVGVIMGNGIQRRTDLVLDAFYRQEERMDGAFQSLEQVDTHQAADTLLTTYLCQTVFALVVQSGVFLHSAG